MTAAVTRLTADNKLLAGARAFTGWHMPRRKVSGSDLLMMGLLLCAVFSAVLWFIQKNGGSRAFEDHQLDKLTAYDNERTE